MNKKVIVIGGGMAGLSAGIYALQNGYTVDLYGKNAVLGGECTGWDRQGYHIDNCIHWLTGCRREDELNRIWRDLGALDDGVSIYREPYFYRLVSDGNALHFWSDIERARREFLNLAPEDEINKFFDCVKYAECVRVPCEKSLAEMNPLEYLRFGMTMAGMGRLIKEYGEDSINDLAGRFKNPHVREMMRCYMNGSYKAVALLSSYGFYSSGTAGIPMGGSTGMVRRIAERFRDMGGKFHMGMTAKHIEIKNHSAQAVTFADGSVVSCDAVICAVDTAVTFGGLMDAAYMDRKLKKMYETPDGYRTASGFQAAFGIIGGEDCGVESGSTVFLCDSFCVGRQKLDHMGMRVYDYDPHLFPADRRVIQCNVLQDAEDYEYWRQLCDDRERYDAEKQRIAGEMRGRLEKKFPLLKDRLILLDSYSPVTFTKWCGAYKGAYMSFFEQKGHKSVAVKNRVRGLRNVFVASQWLSTNGGLPMAVTSGKFAVQSLIDSKILSAIRK